jgi:hypothetical protein
VARQWRWEGARCPIRKWAGGKIKVYKYLPAASRWAHDSYECYRSIRFGKIEPQFVYCDRMLAIAFIPFMNVLVAA